MTFSFFLPVVAVLTAEADGSSTEYARSGATKGLSKLVQ
jgi:hypothetical protein